MKNYSQYVKETLQKGKNPISQSRYESQIRRLQKANATKTINKIVKKGNFKSEYQEYVLKTKQNQLKLEKALRKANVGLSIDKQDFKIFSKREMDEQQRVRKLPLNYFSSRSGRGRRTPITEEVARRQIELFTRVGGTSYVVTNKKGVSTQKQVEYYDKNGEIKEEHITRIRSLYYTEEEKRILNEEAESNSDYDYYWGS